MNEKRLAAGSATWQMHVALQIAGAGRIKDRE